MAMASILPRGWNCSPSRVGFCVSSIVNESVGNRIDVRFQDGGEISVRNIDRPIRVWTMFPQRDNPHRCPRIKYR